MGELQSALDALAGEDLDGLVAPQFLDRTSMLVRARNRIDAELARTARRAELAQAPEHDGLKSMASWLCGHVRLSPAAAHQIVRNGRALEQLPAVAADCADGPTRRIHGIDGRGGAVHFGGRFNRGARH